SMTVYDAASGKRIAGPIDRVRFGATAWTDDSKVVYFNRLAKLKPGEPETDTYKNSTLDAWDLSGTPVTVFGSRTGHGPKFAPEEFPVLALTPGAAEALALSINGVQNEWKAWVAPAAAVGNPATAWKPLVDRDDDVTLIGMRGDEIFLLSHRDAP